jgi:hypothetical protein
MDVSRYGGGCGGGRARLVCSGVPPGATEQLWSSPSFPVLACAGTATLADTTCWPRPPWHADLSISSLPPTPAETAASVAPMTRRARPCQPRRTRTVSSKRRIERAAGRMPCCGKRCRALGRALHCKPRCRAPWRAPEV